MGSGRAAASLEFGYFRPQFIRNRTAGAIGGVVQVPDNPLLEGWPSWHAMAEVPFLVDGGHILLGLPRAFPDRGALCCSVLPDPFTVSIVLISNPGPRPSDYECADRCRACPNRSRFFIKSYPPYPPYNREGIVSDLGKVRRGRDSNPRYPHGHTAFRERRLQPLGHLSAQKAPAKRALLYRFRRKREGLGPRARGRRTDSADMQLVEILVVVVGEPDDPAVFDVVLQAVEEGGFVIRRQGETERFPEDFPWRFITTTSNKPFLWAGVTA